MSVNTENTADASETRGAKEMYKSIHRASPELIEERIGADLEPLSEQIATLTQLFNQLVQDNSAKTPPTAGSRTLRSRTGPSFKRESGDTSTPFSVLLKQRSIQSSVPISQSYVMYFRNIGAPIDGKYRSAVAPLVSNLLRQCLYGKVHLF